MGKVLADPDPVAPDRSNVRGEIRGPFSILKAFVDRFVKRLQPVSQGSPSVEISFRPLHRFPTDFNHLGRLQVIEYKWERAGQNLTGLLNGQIQVFRGEGSVKRLN